MDNQSCQQDCSEPTSSSFATANGYPPRNDQKEQPWKKWMVFEDPKAKKPLIVAIPTKCDFGSANLGGL